MLLFLLPAGAAANIQTSATGSDDALFDNALRWILSPPPNVVQYDYVMTAKVRLLLFWVGADDVGGGYIQRSPHLSGTRERFIQVLFGSDPAKAPRRINYWGAATERSNGETSALLGFMRAARTDSVSEAEADFQKQASEGQHPFDAILSLIEKTRARSRRAPLFSTADLNMHQFDRAQELALGQLAGGRTGRELSGSDMKCAPRGFLQAVDELIDGELIGSAVRAGAATPGSLCYVYNGRNYTLTLQKRSAVSKHSVRIQRKNGSSLEKTYRDLVNTHFSILNHSSGERTGFQLLVGTSGPLRAVPVQIVHQPNWWFRVVLNLEGEKAGI
jgi:hypothetical protein